ncbi:MAG: cation:dicarboxylase symporter family transporter [Pseudomonadales bacterium]|nr:cation:dicarboxylase symporter family transporter [Pseudomonadales bacterium]
MKISTTSQMILAMVVGIAVGLFFGEMVGWMSHIGTAVILLMQMTVFPYIVVSLVHGIGKLDAGTAKSLFGRAGVIMLLLWLFGLVVIFFFPVVFPAMDAASFFSTSSVSDPEKVDYFKLYIPANPFESMAEGYVPAMVLFSIAIGVSLIGMDASKKDTIISVMGTASEIFSRITQGLVKVLPVGIFAMSASAAGTMGFEEFVNLQAYLLTYFVMCFVLGLILFPWLISCFTPLGFWDANRIARAGVVTAFATGNVFIVLPVIVEECKKIMEEKGAADESTGEMLEILVPIAYSFPNIGKFTVILFVFFAGWFSGNEIKLPDVFSLATSGVLSLFGSVYVAIPFMLNIVQIPQDLFQFFVMSGFITGRFGSVVAVLNLFALALLTVSLFQKALSLSLFSWLRLGIGFVVVMVLSIGGMRMLLSAIVDEDGNTSDIITNMRVAEQPAKSLDVDYVEDEDVQARSWVGLEAIRQRGLLRVGVRTNNVPFSYFNKQSEMVGFDVQMATILATDLGVDLEFVAFEEENLVSNLQQGLFDVAMSGIAMDAEQMFQVGYSTPVMELNHALVMKDYLASEIKTADQLKELEQFVVAHVEHDSAVKTIKDRFNRVEFESINTYLEFFNQDGEQWDALIVSAQAGSTWTLLYPEYGVVVLNRHSKFPVSYVVAKDNLGFLRYINNWLQMRKVTGHYDRAYDYWILGKGATEKTARWSVIKDVLEWVEE